MDIRLALMAGTDIPIPECQLILHQPTIKDIAFIGTNEFFKGVQTLCVNKNTVIQDKNILDEVNNFQIFMTIITDKSASDKKEAVKQVLKICFPDYNVMFSPTGSLIFSKSGESPTIGAENFDFLQNILKEVFCANSAAMDQQTFNPANDKAREIAEKLMRGRQRVAEQNGSANIDVFSQYLSILSVGLHIPITQLVDYTMYQLYDEIERYMLYTNWDIDLRGRLAGAKPDSQPDNWMKNIH